LNLYTIFGISPGKTSYNLSGMSTYWQHLHTHPTKRRYETGAAQKAPQKTPKQ